MQRIVDNQKKLSVSATICREFLTKLSLIGSAEGDWFPSTLSWSSLNWIQQDASSNWCLSSLKCLQEASSNRAPWVSFILHLPRSWWTPHRLSVVTAAEENWDDINTRIYNTFSQWRKGIKNAIILIEGKKGKKNCKLNSNQLGSDLYNDESVKVHLVF